LAPGARGRKSHEARRDRTRVSLTQDNNATEEARPHSKKNWAMMLGGLKKFLEG
jgi:hypothetical protein